MINVSTVPEFDKLLREQPKVVVHFWAGWSSPCILLDQVLEQLGHDAPSVACARVEAEEAPELSERWNITAVPFILFFSGGKVVDTLEGADPAALTSKFLALANAATHDAPPPPPAGPGPASLRQRLDALVRQNPIMLFMKGTPDDPRCGFSRKVVAALRTAGAPDFGSFDILSDEAVRQGLKEYSNWPTFPQLYVNGELLGGCDIVLELAAAGELAAELAQAGAGNGGVAEDPKVAMEDRLKALVRRSPVILFMKGSPEAPRCGFSRKVVEAITATGHPFGSFDILEDEEVRQGLKEYSNWPTYPQLYVNGELLGGCDIVLEMEAAGELKGAIDEMLGVTAA